jgi:hypothetical protein
VTSALAQGNGAHRDATAQTLRVTEAMLASPFPQAVILPLRCDAEGNIYARMNYVNLKLKAPMVKFNLEGELAAIYNPGGNPELDSVEGVGQFSVSPEGDVYQLASSRQGSYILRFAQDGRYRGRIHLPAWLNATQLAVFDRNAFLVSGSARQKKSAVMRPFTAVFDGKGRVVKEVTPPDDEDIYHAALSADSSVVSEYGALRAVSMGQAIVGSDGNAYLLRRTTPAVIYAISPAGDLVNTLTVEGEPGMVPRAMQAGEGTLAVMFGTSSDPRTLFKVVDITSGAEVGSYASGSLRSPLACFAAPSTFTFLLNHDKRLVFVKAAP